MRGLRELDISPLCHAPARLPPFAFRQPDTRPMHLLDLLAERHIAEAQERGEFDSLPGAGAPLALEDDRLVPEDLRVAYRMLKNAGFVPPEIEAQCEIRKIEQLIEATKTGDERARLTARIRFLLDRSRISRRAASPHIESDYMAKLAQRLQRRGDSP